MIDDKLISQINTSLSKESRIKLAYVLGSIISNRTKTDSDFDLAVVVESSDKIDYKYIYSLISDIDFPKDLDLSVIDKNSSPLFLFQIISTGKCIYQRSEEEKISFEACTLKNYYDSAHLRKIYYSYLKDKFPYAD
ncbi:nucleotidyltransferase domain-containing protein [Patescibacteria group bacterium]|nr:nucleotidyltransferase domain-containing protein [Patescibacteria group bacterium]